MRYLPVVLGLQKHHRRTDPGTDRGALERVVVDEYSSIGQVEGTDRDFLNQVDSEVFDSIVVVGYVRKGGLLVHESLFRVLSRIGRVLIEFCE